MQDKKNKPALRPPTVHSLARVLSKRGAASRKQAEVLIAAGRVKVNGIVVRDALYRIPLNAQLAIDDLAHHSQSQAFHYAVMHKPKGYVTTRSDEHGRKTVYDLLTPFLAIHAITTPLQAVGRLDKDTAGLLLFTNDFALADLLLDPESRTPKTYLVKLRRPVSPEEFLQLQRGTELRIDGQSHFAKPSRVIQHKPALIELTLIEGKNREVRRLIEASSNKVESLTRIGFANLRLTLTPNLPPTLNGQAFPAGSLRFITRRDLLATGKMIA